MTKFKPDFLQGIKADHDKVRAERVGVLLSTAEYMDETQQGFIDAALKLSPREFEIVLRERIYQTDAPLEDRASAAMLYLRGHDLNLWTQLTATVRFARKLVRTYMELEMEKMTLEEKEVHARLRDAGLVLAKADSRDPKYLMAAVDAWMEACRLPLAHLVRAAHPEFVATCNQIALGIVNKEIAKKKHNGK